MICEKCRHLDDCFEQRGRCQQFETEKQYRKRIKKDIEKLNETAEAPLAVRAVSTDIARQGESNCDD